MASPADTPTAAPTPMPHWYPAIITARAAENRPREMVPSKMVILLMVMSTVPPRMRKLTICRIVSSSPSPFRFHGENTMR